MDDIDQALQALELGSDRVRRRICLDCGGTPDKATSRRESTRIVRNMRITNQTLLIAFVAGIVLLPLRAVIASDHTTSGNEVRSAGSSSIS